MENIPVFYSELHSTSKAYRIQQIFIKDFLHVISVRVIILWKNASKYFTDKKAITQKGPNFHLFSPTSLSIISRDIIRNFCHQFPQNTHQHIHGNIFVWTLNTPGISLYSSKQKKVVIRFIFSQGLDILSSCDTSRKVVKYSA